MSVFGKEAVTGVNRVRSDQLGGADDAVDFEVTLVRRRGPDADGAVGEFQVTGVAVGFAVNGDRFDAEFAASADDAERDFASVGDKNAFKHNKNQSLTSGTRRVAGGKRRTNRPRSSTRRAERRRSERRQKVGERERFSGKRNSEKAKRRN